MARRYRPDLVKRVTESKRNLFPVVDDQNRFLGVVTLDDIRKIMFDSYMYERTNVHELMQMAPEHIDISDSMEKVMEKFENSGAWNLPVIKDNRYYGFMGI